MYRGRKNSNRNRNLWGSPKLNQITMFKKSLKILVIIVILLNIMFLCSCKSGWKCNKRYVQHTEKSNLNTKNS